jgi:hypothetical protein
MTAVVLEDIYAQMKVVIEAVQDCATKRDMDAQFEAVHHELRGLRHDATLRAQSGELRALEQRVLVLERRVGR